MFRPAQGDESVDVAIITQIIAPSLRLRAEDGTYVFDCYGGASKRKERQPEEIIVFCVDCSRSMEESSDFEELKNDDDIDDDDRLADEDEWDDEDLMLELQEIYQLHDTATNDEEGTPNYIKTRGKHLLLPRIEPADLCRYRDQA